MCGIKTHAFVLSYFNLVNGGLNGILTSFYLGVYIPMIGMITLAILNASVILAAKNSKKLWLIAAFITYPLYIIGSLVALGLGISINLSESYDQPYTDVALIVAGSISCGK